MASLRRRGHRSPDWSSRASWLRASGDDDEGLALNHPPATARGRIRCPGRRAAPGGMELKHQKVEMLPPIEGKEGTKQTFQARHDDGQRRSRSQPAAPFWFGECWTKVDRLPVSGPSIFRLTTAVPASS